MLHDYNTAFVQTNLYGGTDGTKFNDLETLGWFEGTSISVEHPISEIVVRCGGVVDAINITYGLKDGGTKTIKHGSQSGGTAYTVTISNDEIITGVCGKAGPNNIYQKTLVNQISFVITNTKTAEVRVKGPYGNADGTSQGSYFQASGLVAIAGYETTGAHTGISGLSFIASHSWV